MAPAMFLQVEPSVVSRINSATLWEISKINIPRYRQFFLYSLARKTDNNVTVDGESEPRLVQAAQTCGHDSRCQCAFVEETWIEETWMHIWVNCSRKSL